MFWSSCTKLSFIKKKNLMKIKTSLSLYRVN